MDTNLQIHKKILVWKDPFFSSKTFSNPKSTVNQKIIINVKTKILISKPQRDIRKKDLTTQPVKV